MIKKLTIILSVLFLISCDSKPEKPQSAVVKTNLLLTDWKKDNLKGKVKEVRLKFRYPESVTLDEKSNINGTNEITKKTKFDRYSGATYSFLEYNSEGFLIASALGLKTLDQPKDSLHLYYFQYDQKNIIEKNKNFLSTPVQFPVTMPVSLKANQEKKNDKYSHFKIYRFQEGHSKITQLSYYETYQADSLNIKKPKLTERDFQYEVNYKYNQLNQVVLAEYKLKRGSLTLMGRNYRENFLKKFSYNLEGKVKQVQIIKAGVFDYQETYTYFDNGGVKVEKLGFLENTTLPYQTYKVVQVFNKYGDLIETLKYDADFGKNVLQEQIYTYTYDDKNNWITCKFTDRSSNENIVIERKIIYY